jgi:hypothetical protein
MFVKKNKKWSSQIVRLVSSTVGTTHFFDVLHASTITAKQLKLRDLFRGIALMSKLAYERKIYFMHKIISLLIILGV